MLIHFIAIGGAAMHSLAIALHERGHVITGSDDEIFDPAMSMLAERGLLPKVAGWHPEKITPDTDIVILGMHAKADNPELKRALQLDIPVYSYPEFLYQETRQKTRVVIAGSHGKTTITAMVMHVLKFNGVAFDYMVGSRLEGFDNMVGLSELNRVAIFEGDEYLSSCLDPRPKFHVYQPRIALVSGIAWDHINVFPTWEGYIDQFRTFINSLPHGGYLVYCSEDPELATLAKEANRTIEKEPYETPVYEVAAGITKITYQGITYPLQVFGHHNMQNMQGARLVCNRLGITDKQFYEAIIHFKGAGKRLQLLGKNNRTAIYLDFAHSPSKVSSTVKAIREQFPDRKITACLELHTFSSLTKNFLQQYIGTMEVADHALVYYSPETIVQKRLEAITPEDVKKAFNKEGMVVFTDRDLLTTTLLEADLDNSILLLMSSGNFSGLHFQSLADRILSGKGIQG